MARPSQRHDWSPPRSGSGYGPFRTGPRTDPAGPAGAGVPGHGTGSEERGSDFFAFIRAWAAGIAVLIVTEYLQISLVYENTVGPAGPRSAGASLLVVHLPNLVCIALAAWAAARAHPHPQCARTARHIIAVCAVPALAQLLMLTTQREQPGIDALGLWLSTAVMVTGCVLGWTADRLQRGHRA